MRFNTIDMRTCTCTSTCENHAGGAVTMHYVVFYGRVFNTMFNEDESGYWIKICMAAEVSNSRRQ